ncbi:MAG: hypothetical protein ABDH59_06695 [Fervidobacterium sp.]
MNSLTKFIVLSILFVIILFLSLKANRVIDFDYSDQITEEASYNGFQKSESSQIPVKKSDDEGNIILSENTKSSSSLETQTDFIKKNERKPSTKEMSELPSIIETYSETTMKTDFESTPIQSGTFFEESADKIYSEILEFEQSVRKYISKGYRISTLNSENVKNAGLVNEELAERYEVTFRVSGEGYEIIITPKYSMNEEIRVQLARNKGINLKEGILSYSFWIKAYR